MVIQYFSTVSSPKELPFRHRSSYPFMEALYFNIVHLGVIKKVVQSTNTVSKDLNVCIGTNNFVCHNVE